MRYIFGILGIIFGIIFLFVALWIVPQYFFSKTIVKPSSDGNYEARINLKRIPGGTLTQLFELHAIATVKIYDTVRKKNIGSSITISGKQCIKKYGKKSEMIQWTDNNSLLVWCFDVHVIAKMGYDRDFTTLYVNRGRVIRTDIVADTLLSYFVDPRSLFE
ncbi:MAG: hypothetical protein RBU23_02625 [Candidatus Auribacterota bacterium]|jgi:hypothetical protein|nr:hypothetical protein [Candidatus Auribacterota bacterium]